MTRQTYAEAPSRPTTTAVSRGVLQRRCACGGKPGPDGECAGCRAKRLQRRAAGQATPTAVPPIVNEALGSPGRPLDPAVRAHMEPRFGHDFGKVRVHADGRAAESAEAVDALAYTVGSDVVFAAGQYAPGTPREDRLLAHELTHVVQQRALRSHATGVAARKSRAEDEAERTSREITASGEPVPIREAVGAGQLSRQEHPEERPATKPASAPARRLRFDVLGANLSVTDALVRAAAQALDADIRVTSLEDMIGQLNAQAGPGTGRCVEHLNIWNHGKPAGQMLAGTETIRTSDGQTYRLPRSAMSLDWLLSEGNQSALGRLRDVFCCDAAMRWLGCGTAGMEAAGGVRSEAERTGSAASRLRYGTYGDRYRDAQDAAAHGASLMGATFGGSNAQSWADATCTTVTASTDFTYINPANPGQLVTAGHGGEFVAFPPGQMGKCLCDLETGRPRGEWKITEAKRSIKGEAEAATGDGYLWGLYLKTFRALWEARSRVRDEVVAALLRLVREAAVGASIPGALPVGEFRPWVNIDTKDPGWAAVTSPHLVLCHPDNCWRWITINQKAVQTTPEYTRTVLDHELLHAGDMWTAAQEYRRLHGDPPAGAGDRCRPVAEGVRGGWKDAWGQYVNGFIEFQERGLAPMRHEEIYAEAVAPHFDRMTQQEKLEWFHGVLQNIPPDLDARQTFEAEQMVLRLFEKPVPEQLGLRQEMAKLLSRTTLNVDEGRSRSLLRHFGPVWKLRPAHERKTLQDLLE